MHKMKHWLTASLVIMALVLLGGCQAAKPETAAPSTPAAAKTATVYPLTIKDAAGTEFTFEKQPEVVVSLSPAATEIVFAIGKEDLLKGRTDYCNFPPEAQKIPSLGSIMEPNVEAIVALKPDVVFVSKMFSEDVKAQMDTLGIKVFDLASHDTFEGVYTAITSAGQILGAPAEAEQIVAEMQKTISEVSEKVKGSKPKSTYYVVGYGEYGDFTAGKGTFIDQMITLAGGINAANDVEGWKYSLEKLIEKNPDYLICRNDGGDQAGIEAANGYKELSAVKEGRLIAIENELLDVQGPRTALGVLTLAKILHPELFK